ncbi:MAG: adenylyl-sulfate kinase [Gammaproteobacteria bacterium]|nr:adenylyl-sulfate kinase [Gammaproteobacteria bacterium]
MSQADIFPHHSHVTRDMRNQQVGHRSGVIWLTGLSGAGKSTIATQVELELFREGFLVSVLDGDTMRSGLNCDLDFTRQARMENLRRAGEVASLFAMMGYIVLATFISPHHEGRRFVRNIVRKNFHLVHVRASLEDCIQRDPKGLYQKALSGDIANFTGISQAYEEPQDAELKIDTTSHTLPLCTAQLKNFIKDNFLLT